MPTVHFPRGLLEHTGGIERLTLAPADAPRVHELILVLTDRFPGLAGPIQEMAIAINGEIHHDAGYQPLGADSEVHLIPRIAGG